MPASFGVIELRWSAPRTRAAVYSALFAGACVGAWLGLTASSTGTLFWGGVAALAAVFVLTMLLCDVVQIMDRSVKLRIDADRITAFLGRERAWVRWPTVRAARLCVRYSRAGVTGEYIEFTLLDGQAAYINLRDLEVPSSRVFALVAGIVERRDADGPPDRLCPRCWNWLPHYADACGECKLIQPAADRA